MGTAARARVEKLAEPSVLVARWREIYERQGLALGAGV
jgi:hypothetical protein